MYCVEFMYITLYYREIMYRRPMFKAMASDLTIHINTDLRVAMHTEMN